MSYPEVKSDDDWQAEMDANTLAEAKKIMGDDNRRTAAEKAAARLADEKREDANNLRRVAKQSPWPIKYEGV